MIPVGPDGGEQFIYIIDKDYNGNINQEAVLSVRYVPLTSSEKQLKTIL